MYVVPYRSEDVCPLAEYLLDITKLLGYLIFIDLVEILNNIQLFKEIRKDNQVMFLDVQYSDLFSLKKFFPLFFFLKFKLKYWVRRNVKSYLNLYKERKTCIGID